MLLLRQLLLLFRLASVIIGSSSSTGLRRSLSLHVGSIGEVELWLVLQERRLKAILLQLWQLFTGARVRGRRDVLRMAKNGGGISIGRRFPA